MVKKKGERPHIEVLNKLPKAIKAHAVYNQATGRIVVQLYRINGRHDAEEVQPDRYCKLNVELHGEKPKPEPIIIEPPKPVIKPNPDYEAKMQKEKEQVLEDVLNGRIISQSQLVPFLV